MKKTFLLLMTLWLAVTTGAWAQTATAPSNGDGTESNPYEIANLDNLYWLSQNNTEWSKYFIQTAYIDATDTKNWDISGSDTLGFSPIGNSTTKFKGAYNGKGYDISGLSINRSTENYIALFGYIEDASIDSLGIVSCSIVGSTNTGGLIGYSHNYSTVRYCYSTGSIAGTNNVGGLVGCQEWQPTVSYCYSTSSVSGSSNTGGLIGYNYNSSTLGNSYSTGSVSGVNYVGGLVGYNYIKSTISNCYSTGYVSGSTYVGGLVGSNNYFSTISKCYYNSEISGQTDTGKGSGLTTLLMKQSSSYSSWDFINTWGVNEDNTYPALLNISNNAPFGYGETEYVLDSCNLLLNDYDYENGQNLLILKVVSSSAKGTVNNGYYKFNPNEALRTIDTVTYCVGEIIAIGDTLCGNNVVATLTKLDYIPASVSLSTTASSSVNGDFNVSITFSEEVSGFEASDLTIINGSVNGALVSSDNITYTATITPTADGTITISLGWGVAQDLTGHDTEPSATNLSFVADLTAPTVSLSTTATSPVIGDFEVSITFSEEVSDFEASDLTIVNGSVNGALVSSDNITYTATITSTADGTISISLVAGVAQDLTGNNNEAAAESIELVAYFPIGISCVKDSKIVNKDGVNNTDRADTNYGTQITISLYDSEWGTERDYVRSLIDFGTLNISKDQIASATLYLYNYGDYENEGSNSFKVHSFSQDWLEDVVTWNNCSALATDASYVSVPSSNGITNFEIDVLSLLQESSDGISASFYLALDAGVNYQKDIVYLASKENTDLHPKIVIMLNDGTEVLPPSVSLSTTETLPVSGDFDVSITFSEEVSGFEASDLTIANGSVNGTLVSSDNITYTATITPTTDGNITISLAASVVQNLAGIDNEATDNLVVVADFTAPTVSLSTTATSPVSGDFDVNITFSEEVSGFEASDLTLVNGSVNGGTLVTSDNITYVATIRPVADGTITISLAAGVVQDLAGNDNEAALINIELTVDYAPTVSLSTDATSPTSGDFDVTITFSEEVSGFEASDVTIVNGSVNGNLVSSDNITYTGTITPTVEGNVIISLVAGVAKDLASNDNEAAVVLAVVYDNDNDGIYTFPPLKDARVVKKDFSSNSDRADTNYGAIENLSLYDSQWGTERDYIKTAIDFGTFNLSLQNITSATLKLFSYGTENEGTNSFYVYSFTQDWVEDVITWNNCPAVEIDASSIVVDATTGVVDLEIDVLSLLKENDEGVMASFFLELVGGIDLQKDIVVFASKENADASLHPQLVLEYDDYPTAIINNQSDLISYYPNPASDKFTINVDNVEGGIVDIYSLSGQLVMTCTLQQAEETFDIGQLGNGVYLLHIKTSTRTVTRKLVVKK